MRVVSCGLGFAMGRWITATLGTLLGTVAACDNAQPSAVFDPTTADAWSPPVPESCPPGEIFASGYPSCECSADDPLDRYPREVFVDADEDGHGLRGSAGFTCEQVEPPAGFIFWEPSIDDCDDTDPEVADLVQFYVDSDGDGFGAGDSIYVCGDRPPEGYAPPGDCDDSDPTVSVLKFEDGDGDGHGGDGDAVCVNEATPGYTGSHDDCDDGDAGIYPDAPEHPLDGVDSNCDGLDYPDTRCSDSLSAEPVEPHPGGVCDGEVDLVMLASDNCMNCRNLCETRVIVGNRGSVPAAVQINAVGPFAPDNDASAFPYTLEEPLPAGASVEFTLPRWFRAPFTLDLASADGTADCNPDDNRVVVGCVDIPLCGS